LYITVIIVVTAIELFAILLVLFFDKWFRLLIEGGLWHFFFDLGSLDRYIVSFFNRLWFGLVKKCGLALEIDILGLVYPSGAIHALIRPLHKNNW
jgi:hypothetical protein